MRRQDNICRVRLFFVVALTAAVMIGAVGVRRAGARKMAGHEIEMGEKETKEGLPVELEKVMKDETEEVLEQEEAKRADTKRTDTKTEDQDRGKPDGAAEAAAGAGRAQASGRGTMPEPDMIFQGELKPQSAMEAGRGMQWKLDWEFAGEGEWTWTE